MLAPLLVSVQLVSTPSYQIAQPQQNNCTAAIELQALFVISSKIKPKVTAMRIAFFDSGLGGITVLGEAIKQLPTENFLYYADTLHVPYGTKSMEDVRACVHRCVEAIVKEDVKALVVACNTATSVAIAQLRQSYDIPIIGMEPAVKPAVEMNRSTGRRVLVLATPLTLRQSKYAELVSRIDDRSIVDSLPLPELVQYCEQLNFDRRTMIDYFNAKLSGFDLSLYGAIVLGCTHYPFYRNILQDVVTDRVPIIDGSVGTVNRLAQLLHDRSELNLHGCADVAFMCSGDDNRYISKMRTALDMLRSRMSL
jgi:glutamate racemase